MEMAMMRLFPCLQGFDEGLARHYKGTLRYVSLPRLDAETALHLFHEMRGHCDEVVLVRRRDLVGLILVKDLVLVDMNAGTKVSNIRIRNLPFLRADTPMYDLLKVFQTGRSHMLVLTRHPDMQEDLLRDRPSSPHANGHDSPSRQVRQQVSTY